MSDNALIDFLRDEKIRIIASKMPAFQDNIIDKRKASDFEVYCALSANIRLLCGNPIRDTFLDLLSKASRSEISCEDLSDAQYRKELWKRIFVDGDIQLPKPSLKVNEVKLNSKKRNRYLLDGAIRIGFDSIYELLDNALNEIKGSDAESVYLDARSIKFIRPDDFHAQISYDEFKNGGEEPSLLKLWLLCRILMNTKLSLDLSVENFKDAQDILSLVFRLGLSPNMVISIDISREVDYNSIYDFLMHHHKKNISLEIFYPKENDEMLNNFLKIVPLVFIDGVNSMAVR